MIRVTKTYDGYAVWRKTPIRFGAAEITTDTLVTEFTNILDLVNYLNIEMFKDYMIFGECWTELDGIEGNN